MADGAQVSETWTKEALQALFDPSTGWLDRRVLSDQALYQLELERIFARSWNFMCHESMIPKVGERIVA